MGTVVPPLASILPLRKSSKRTPSQDIYDAAYRKIQPPRGPTCRALCLARRRARARLGRRPGSRGPGARAFLQPHAAFGAMSGSTAGTFPRTGRAESPVRLDRRHGLPPPMALTPAGRLLASDPATRSALKVDPVVSLLDVTGAGSERIEER